MRTSALFAIASATLIGCATTTADLQRETALFIGGDTSDSQVSVTDVERGSAGVRWKAIAPTGSYDCSADDKLRHVQCVNLENRPVAQQPGPGPGGSAAQAGSNVQQAPGQGTESRSSTARMSIREAQLMLNLRGFKAGKADGRLGPRTSNAIKAFQRAKGLPQTGQLDAAMEQALRQR